MPRLAILGRNQMRTSQLCAVARARDLDAYETTLPLSTFEMDRCDLILVDAGKLGAEDRLWLRGILNTKTDKPIIAICDGIRVCDAVDLVDAGIEDVLDWATLTSAQLARVVHLGLARRSARPNVPKSKSEPAAYKTETVTLLQECASAIVMVDPDGMVQFANPDAEQLLGVPVGSLAGAPFALELTGEGKQEILLDGASGRQVHTDVRVVEADHGGVPIRVVSLQDMSLRHVLEKYFSA